MWGSIRHLAYTTYLLLAFILCFIKAHGQSDSLTKNVKRYWVNHDDRKWHASIPIWVPGFRGDFAFGDLEVSTSQSGDDKSNTRFENELGIEFYFVGSLSYNYKRWFLSTDAFSGTITDEVFYNKLLKGDPASIIKLKVRGTFIRFIAGYSVFRRENENSRFEIIPYFGLRHFDVGLESAVLDTIYVGAVNPTWSEIILGISVPFKYKRWQFAFRGDFGQIDSNVSWMTNMLAAYRFSPLFDMKLGWTHLEVVHDEEKDKNRLNIRIGLSGPTLGLGFHF